MIGNAFERMMALQEKLDAAAGKKVFLLPVTKSRSVEQIRPILDGGCPDIGENRVQEWLQKRPLLGDEARLHLIGRLQTNKVNKIIDHVHLIQSMDRLSLLEEIEHQAAKIGRKVRVLAQINPAREPQKGGALPEEVEELCRAAMQCEHVQLCGMMMIAPAAEDPRSIAPLFVQARKTFESMQPYCGKDFTVLSMGMSRDALVAAENGANMVRMGTILFADNA